MAIKKEVRMSRYTTVRVPLADHKMSEADCKVKFEGGEYVIEETVVTVIPVSRFYKKPSAADLNDISIEDGNIVFELVEEV